MVTEQLRKYEMERSFDPREWFDWDDEPTDNEAGATEARIMWVYRPNAGTGMWDVGYFAPDTRQFVTESSLKDKVAAADRVHWLNGGTTRT